MSSGSNLYKFDAIKDELKKFRMSTSRSDTLQAAISRRLIVLPKPDQIDRKSLEIQRSEDETYTDLEALADDLPENSPRYVLMSYPLTISGRFSVPYVLLYYMPPTASSEMRMLYADAKEKMREHAGTTRVIDISRPSEDLEEKALEERLSS